jgi:hypothetical protein
MDDETFSNPFAPYLAPLVISFNDFLVLFSSSS